MDIELITDAARRYRAGLKHFANIGRTLVNSADVGRRPLLRNANDRFCLEPLLFAHFTKRAPPQDLLQIAFGYIEEPHRPGMIPVRSNREGVVCLPSYGYLGTTWPEQDFSLRWDAASRTCSLEAGNETVNYTFARVADSLVSGIELSLNNHHILDYLSDAEGSGRGINLVAMHLEHVNKALEIIRSCYPSYYEMIRAITRRIVLFDNDQLNSFASTSFFGCVFLNVKQANADEVYFIEDLVHQCGHLLFSTLTHNIREFLRVPGDAPVGSNSTLDRRSFYSAFHGLFTEAVMNQCFDRCLEANIFRHKQRHELLGRFALILRRFNRDLMIMRDPSLYTDEGAQIYEGCRRIFEDVCSRRASLLRDFDFSEQPYAFDYRVFERNNPLEDQGTEGPSAHRDTTLLPC